MQNTIFQFNFHKFSTKTFHRKYLTRNNKKNFSKIVIFLQLLETLDFYVTFWGFLAVFMSFFPKQLYSLNKWNKIILCLYLFCAGFVWHFTASAACHRNYHRRAKSRRAKCKNKPKVLMAKITITDQVHEFTAALILFHPKIKLFKICVYVFVCVCFCK